jgi:hypothetical protein
MRLELAGSMVRPQPLIVVLKNAVPFIPQQYMSLGYTNYDVICIGAGGGMGGGIKTAGSGTIVRNFGGAGGGGGLHRVSGLLNGLPASCPVVLGSAGQPGTEHVSDPALTTDGTDGGATSFNGAMCQASGGRGGTRAQSNSTSVGTNANGGQGGCGNRALAGGGALGGTAGVPSPTGPGTPGTVGSDGTWDGTVGQGGGGGAGGVGTYAGITANAATAGGQGSYDVGDTSVSGPAYSPSSDLADSGSSLVVPGAASGAKATPLNNLPTIYGRSLALVPLVQAENGYAVILLKAILV